MSRHHCDVLVVGGGIAGLSAATRLAEAGVDVHVLEAADRVGGRVRGEPVGSGLLDTGAEFVGQPHTRLRRLINDLGLQTEPARLDRAPILWRLPAQQQISRRPPVPLRDLRPLLAAWWRLRSRARTVDPDQPWASPLTGELDSVSLAAWLTAHGVTEPGLQLTDAMIGGFATRPIDQVSAAHAAWWIAAAGGLLAALRSGQQHLVRGGAHHIPRRLARQLGDRVHLGSPVLALGAHRGGVEARTTEHTWSADAAIVALPLPALRALRTDPQPDRTVRAALHELSYGRATKIATTTTVTPPVPHRAVVGGHPLAIAWRHGRTVAGISSTDASTHELTADLAAAFGITTEHLQPPAVTNWTQEPHIGGSYLVHAPGQLTRHAPDLRQAHVSSVRYAGADFSSWPNSMEGAVQSGQNSAAVLLQRSHA